MKFLHTSDLHLGLSLCERSLIEYQQMLPDILCEAAEQCACDVVILAGDLYDNALSNSEAISIYNRLMTKLCLEHGKKVILCAGNHDGAARLSSCSDLLKECGLHIYGRVQIPVQPLVFEDCNVYVLPYFNVDEIRAAFPDASIKSYADAMNTILDDIRATLDESRVNMLVAHCFVTGGELSDSDTAARIGGSSAIPTGVFSDFDYVALGHLHKPQTLAGRIRYSGTPLKYSFSEAGHNKSFTLFDTSDGSITEIPVPQPVELKVIEDAYENLLTGQENPNTFYKIIMKDRFAGQETYSRLKEIYPNLLQLQGCTVETDGAFSLTLEEITRLSPTELVKRFYTEQTGSDISKEQLDWFQSSLEESTQGGELQ